MDTVMPVNSNDNAQLQQWGRDSAQLKTWANTLLIANLEGFEAANSKLVVLKDLLKALKDEKERRYRPIKVALDQVADDFNPHIKVLEDVEKTVRSKMATYHAAEQARKRREEEAAAEERRQQALRDAAASEAALQAQTESLKQEAEAAAAEARAAGDEDMAAAIEHQTQAGLQAMEQAHQKTVDERFTAADNVAEVAKTRTTEAGTQFTTRMVRRHKLVDISKVPAEYLLLNDAAVRQAMANGVASIPGIEFYDEAVGSVVTARRAA